MRGSRRSYRGSTGVKDFSDLTKQELLALAIALEEDSRTYR
jgi:hypothetical protein